MLNISKVPFDEVHPDLKKAMQESDAALGGSEWIQVFAHTPDLYRDFAKFYYKHIMTDSDGISLKLTELVRHKVALVNQCSL